MTADGYVVQPAMTIPQDATEVVVNETGQVYVRIGTDNRPAAARPADRSPTSPTRPASIRSAAISIARPLASGAPVTRRARRSRLRHHAQGYLENSNVDPVKEITELISAQRAYEMNSKVIQAADEMFGTVSKGMR